MRGKLSSSPPARTPTGRQKTKPRSCCALVGDSIAARRSADLRGAGAGLPISSCHPPKVSNCVAVDQKLEPRGLARCNCANKKYGALSVPVPRYRYVMLLLYQEDVRKRGEAILGAGTQPRLPQEDRAGPEPVKPRPSRVWPLTPYRLRVCCGDRDVGLVEALEGERVREVHERDGPPPDRGRPVRIRADLRRRKWAY
jgi:hypothetical protein